MTRSLYSNWNSALNLLALLSTFNFFVSPASALNASLCTSPSNAVNVTVPQVECETLVTFYNSTGGGVTWNTAPGPEKWETGNSISNWEGVTVKSSKVGKLKLASRQLTGVIPPELGQLTSMTVLSLRVNNLTGSVPKELGQLLSLKQLVLNSNQLTGVIPPELGLLTNLTDLRLRANQLTGTIPTEIGSLTNLKVLKLGSNFLTGSVPNTLLSLANLIVMEIQNNNLSGNLAQQFVPLIAGNLVTYSFVQRPPAPVPILPWDMKLILFWGVVLAQFFYWSGRTKRT